MNSTDPKQLKKEDFLSIARGLISEALRSEGKKKISDTYSALVTHVESSQKLNFPPLTCPLGIKELRNHPPVTISAGTCKFVIIGGGGVVIKVHHSEVPSVEMALKVMRPSLFDTKQTPDDEKKVLFEQEVEKAFDEYRKGLSLSHQNIVKTLAASELELQKGPFTVKVPVILAEWVDGAMELDKFLIDPANTLTPREFVRLMKGIFSGLQHLHEKGLVHNDIKCPNILISKEKTPKITDLGNAQFFSNKKPVTTTTIQTSRWNIPQELEKNIGDGNESQNRITIALPHNKRYASPWLDLWMIGKELNRFLKAVPKELERDESLQNAYNTKGGRYTFYHAGVDRNNKPYDLYKEFLQKTFPENKPEAQYILNYLQVIVKRLLKAAKIGPRDDTEIYYESASAVLRDLQKLDHELGAAQDIVELATVPRRNIRLPKTAQANDINTPLLQAVTNTLFFRRLRGRRQLATASHLYPGATHTRYEHSIGVFETTLQYIKALYADTTSCAWRLIVERDDVEALILAALLHDVGHYAFAHYLEDYAPDLKKYKHENYITAVLNNDRIADIHPALHEQAEADASELKSALESVGFSNDRAKTILKKAADIIQLPEGHQTPWPELADTPLISRFWSEQAKKFILHSIIDGGLDADKLDYLARDCHHAGLKYADSVDDRRLFQSLTTAYDKREILSRASISYDSFKPTIAVTKKGILPVCTILTARSLLYDCIYWHSSVRAEATMVKALLTTYLNSSKTDSECDDLLGEFISNLFFLDDASATSYLTKVASTSQFATDLAKGIAGDETYRFVEIFDLHYRKSPPSSEPKPTTDIENVFNYVERIHDVLKTASSLRHVVTARMEIQKQLISTFSGQLKERNPTSTISEPLSILVDIPPATKGQVRNIFVTERDFFEEISDINPTADALDSVFQKWGRRIRVFMSPALYRQLTSEGLSKRQLHEICLSTLNQQLSFR